MTDRIVLASGSQIRQTLLRNAAIPFDVEVARIDEDALRQSLQAEDAGPRDIADTLAEQKARKVGLKIPEALVIGCDQVAAFEGEILAKPTDPDDAFWQLRKMSGAKHQLLSAAVIYHESQPVWRHVGVVRMHMRQVSETYLHDYIERNWASIRHSVGAYKLEEEGVRLFHRVEGDYFHVLGLPLMELIAYLTLRGTLPG